MLNNWSCHLSQIYFNIPAFYKPNVSNRVLSTRSCTFGICVLVLRIHKGYLEAKKVVENVRIIAFWYTKNIKLKLRIKTSFSITLGLISDDLLSVTFCTHYLFPFKKRERKKQKGK